MTSESRYLDIYESVMVTCVAVQGGTEASRWWPRACERSWGRRECWCCGSRTAPGSWSWPGRCSRSRAQASAAAGAAPCPGNSAHTPSSSPSKRQIIFYNFNQIIIYLSTMNNESWSSIPYLAVDRTSKPPLRVDSSVDDVGRHVRQKLQMWSLLLVLSTLLLQVLAGLCLHQLGLLLGLDVAEDPPVVDTGQHAVVGRGLAGGNPAVRREPVRGVAAGLLLLKIGI